MIGKVILVGNIIVIMIAIIAVIIKAFRMKTIFETILAANFVSAQIVMIIAILGSHSGNSSYIDVAIIYALTSFIATIAYLKCKESLR
jgi:multisubunit Na+/H+ antiporter MnhF subunit